MVDYTKPAMRDESWRRWKGGQKLADELRTFYTNKRVFDRLGQSVPTAAGEKPGRDGSKPRTRLVQRLHMGVAQRNAQKLRRSVKRRVEAAATPLPGQDAPR